MGTRMVAFMVLLAAGCSEPLLKNAPQVPTGAAAGVGAAAAAVATLADPVGAQQKAESAKKQQDEQGARSNEGVPVKETVPASVFDKLERAPTGKAGTAGAQGAGEPGAGSGSAADASAGSPVRAPGIWAPQAPPK